MAANVAIANNAFANTQVRARLRPQGQAQAQAPVLDAFVVNTSTPSAVQYQEGVIVLWASLFVLIAAVMFLLVMGLIRRHTRYMRTHPWRFTAEVLIVSVVCSLPILLAAWLRDSPLTTALAHTAILALKFGVLWVLCELTGANEIVFPHTRR